MSAPRLPRNLVVITRSLGPTENPREGQARQCHHAAFGARLESNRTSALFDVLGDNSRFVFGLVAREGRAAAGRRRVLHPLNSLGLYLCALLRDVRELVGEKPTSRVGVRSVLAGSKEHIAPESESSGVELPGRRSCCAIRVNPNVRKIAAETRLHKRPACGG